MKNGKLQVQKNGSMAFALAFSLVTHLLGEDLTNLIAASPYAPNQPVKDEDVLPIEVTDTDKFLFKAGRFTAFVQPSDFEEMTPSNEDQIGLARDTLSDLFWANLRSRVTAADPDIRIFGVRKDWRVVRVE